MARPDKLTPEAHKAIIDALSIGCTRKDSAESAGISYVTFLNWLETGQASKRGRFFEFLNAVTIAEAEARKKYTSTIARAAADGDWRAAETFLKRRDPENWGDRSKVDLNVSESDITAAIERELARLAATGKGQDAGSLAGDDSSGSGD